MPWQLHPADLTLRAPGADEQTTLDEALLEILIHSVVAEVLLGVVMATTDRVQKSPRLDLDALVAGAFGTAFTPVGQCAGQRSNYAVGGRRILFRRVRVDDSQNIARIL